MKPGSLRPEIVHGPFSHTAYSAVLTITASCQFSLHPYVAFISIVEIEKPGSKRFRKETPLELSLPTHPPTSIKTNLLNALVRLFL